jgi:hypothetical protein
MLLSQKTRGLFSIRSQEKDYTGSMKTPSMILCGAALLGAGFVVGRISAPDSSLVVGQNALERPTQLLTTVMPLSLTQNQTPNGGTPQQAPNDPRELIPLGPQPGQGQGGAQPQPGQGQAPEDCPVMIYQDGQLYTFPRPGQQPGQQPGQGSGNGPGQGQGQELIPLDPGAPGGSPSSPGSPAPSVPSPTIPTIPSPRS